MAHTFNYQFFANNRKKLQELAHKSDLIIVAANGLVQRNSDVTFPFRQDSNFWYLTGLEEPDLLLVMGDGREFIIYPERDTRRATFDGQIDQKDLATTSGIREIYGEKDGWQQLTELLQQHMTIATLLAPKSYERTMGFFTNPARARLIKRLKAKYPGVKINDVRSHLVDMRLVKQPAELVAIEAAVAISVTTFNQVKSRLQSLSSELEVVNMINGEFADFGVVHAYQPIVAGGSRACTLHYIKNNHALEDGDLVLIDAGAEYRNYASDITRTYSYGSASARQKAVHDAVVAVQDYAYTVLKAGVTLKDYEQSIESYMGEQLRSLGLIKTINRKNVRRYYPHATSHFLGLDTHDVGYYNKPIPEGAVLTVEPGIYIPEESIGIRIEDNVIITKTGVTVISADLSRSLD